MKKLIVISIFLMSLAFTYSQQMNLKEYAHKEGVTAVTISKNMLSLFPKNADITYGGINVGEFVDKLSAINVFASRKQDAAKQLVKDAAEFLELSGFEKLVSMKTKKEEQVDFFVQSNEEYISEFVLIVQGETKESAVMQFAGKFTMEDIQQMIASANK